MFVHGSRCVGFSALFHRNARLWSPGARAYPVRAFLCLAPDETDAMHALGAADAVGRLVSSMVTWRQRSAAEQQDALETACTWAKNHPVYELRCTLGQTVWEPIRRELYGL